MKNLKYLLRKRSNTYTKADLIHLISKVFKLSLINLTLSSQLPVTKNQIKEKKANKKVFKLCHNLIDIKKNSGKMIKFCLLIAFSFLIV